MEIYSTDLDLKVKIQYTDEKTFTFSDIKFNSSNEEIYALAEALCALQNKNIATVHRLEDFGLQVFIEEDEE